MRLAKLRSMFVISQGSTSALDARGLGAEEAARALDVDYVASGTLSRQGERLRLAAQLVETRSARILWSDVLEAPRRGARGVGTRDELDLRLRTWSGMSLLRAAPGMCQRPGIAAFGLELAARGGEVLVAGAQFAAFGQRVEQTLVRAPVEGGKLQPRRQAGQRVVAVRRQRGGQVLQHGGVQRAQAAALADQPGAVGRAAGWGSFIQPSKRPSEEPASQKRHARIILRTTKTWKSYP